MTSHLNEGLDLDETEERTGSTSELQLVLIIDLWAYAHISHL